MPKVTKKPKHHTKNTLNLGGSSSIIIDENKNNDVLKQVKYAPLTGTDYHSEFYGEPFNLRNKEQILTIIIDLYLGDRPRMKSTNEKEYMKNVCKTVLPDLYDKLDKMIKKIYDHHQDGECSHSIDQKVDVFFIHRKKGYSHNATDFCGGTVYNPSIESMSKDIDSYGLLEINSYDRNKINIKKIMKIIKKLPGYIYGITFNPIPDSMMNYLVTDTRKQSIRVIGLFITDNPDYKCDVKDYRLVYKKYPTSGIQYVIQLNSIESFEFVQLECEKDQTDTYRVWYRDHNVEHTKKYIEGGHASRSKPSSRNLLFYTGNRYCEMSEYPKLVDTITRDIRSFKEQIKEENFDPDDYYYQKVVAPIEEAAENNNAVARIVYDLDQNRDMIDNVDDLGDIEDNIVIKNGNQNPNTNIAFQNNRNLTEDEFMEEALRAIEEAEQAERIEQDEQENLIVSDEPEQVDIDEEPRSAFSAKADQIMKEIYDFTIVLAEIIGKMVNSKSNSVKEMMIKFYTELFGLNQVRDQIEAHVNSGRTLKDEIRNNIEQMNKIRQDDFEADVGKHIHRGYNGDSGETYLTFIDDSKGTSDICVVNAVRPDQSIYYGFRTYNRAGFFSCQAGNSKGKTIPIFPSESGSPRSKKWMRIVYGQRYGSLTDSQTSIIASIDKIRFFCSASLNMLDYNESEPTKRVELQTIYDLATSNIQQDFVKDMMYCEYYKIIDAIDRFKNCITDYWNTESKPGDIDYKYKKIIRRMKLNQEPYYDNIGGKIMMLHRSMTEALKSLVHPELFIKDLPHSVSDIKKEMYYDDLVYAILCLIPNILIDVDVEGRCRYSKKKKKVKHIKAFYDSDTIKKLIKIFGEVKIHYFTQGFEEREPLYYCYYMMESTEETGGYTFYPHKTKSNEYCYPNYVVSPEVYEMWSRQKDIHSVKCPVCCQILKHDRLVKVAPLDDNSDSESIDNVENESDQNKTSVERKTKTDEISGKSFHPKNSLCLKKLTKLRFDFDTDNRAKFKDHLIFGHSSNDAFIFSDGKKMDSEFKSKVPEFLNKISFQNIVVAGGMCRSILLRQPIQDIDVFFIGLDEEGVRKRTITLINDVINANHKIDPNMRFILMHKPLYKVVELLCVKRNIQIETADSMEECEDDSGDDCEDDSGDDCEDNFGEGCKDLSSDEEVLKIESNPHVTLEEDEDSEKKMFCDHQIVHKVQIILRVQDTIKDVFHNFDMHPSCVAYNGSKVLFNQHSYIAYKYMVNLVEPVKSKHDRYNYRALKYYKYGFAIGLDKNKIDPEILAKFERVPKSFKVDRCKFETKYRGKPLEEMGYIPVSEFKIMKRDELTQEDKNGEEVVYADPLYKSYDLDANVSDLYDYIKEEGIKYCYLSKEIGDLSEISEVLDPSKMDFLISTRDVNYNWYDPRRMEIRT